MSLKISRILHAGYLFECNQTKIAFDPLFENPFSKNCYAFPNLEFDLQAISRLELDAVFISHYHDDHFSLESLNLLNRNTPIYIYSIFEEFISLIKDLGFQKVFSIELNKPIQIGAFEILPRKALDEDVDSLYHIKADGKNILNVVDSWIHPQTLDTLLKTKWDFILWPFQTMREIEVIAPSVVQKVDTAYPPELLEQIQQLKPKVIIPSSCQFQFEEWSWYNEAFFPISYASFEKHMKEILPETIVQRLNSGESLDGERLSWIKPIGKQNVDYKFNPDVIPMPISEIAKKFPALSEDQKAKVDDFCKSLMKDNWKLIVYNHKGETTTYGTGDWITEISEAKLYGALFEGESLTSIYIRVTPDEGSDPLEDPLICALYNGKIGAYQKAQIKQLKKSMHRYAKRELLP